MNGNEDNRLTRRLGRYARVTGTVGGLAARVAGQRYLGLNFPGGELPAEIRAALGGLKGPLMKVAQLLATIPDVLPDEYVEELRQLQANAPGMGRLFVRRRMSAELGPGWRDMFSGFDETAAAAASLGQVHRAHDHDGRTLACKLQYPDMASTVEADLAQLRVILALYERYDRAVRSSEIYKELQARVREELDYSLERRHLELYRFMLEAEEAVHLAEPVEELSTGRLLTMTWLEGQPLHEFMAQNSGLEMRNRVAHHMFRAWYVPFYFYGVIHGDPHLGNYTFRPDGSVNLMDFGCIRVFPAPFVRGVIDLYVALRDGDEELAVEAYRNWGFDDIDRETIEVLNHWARYLYGPLMVDRVRTIRDRDGGADGRKVVGRVHAELRRLNGVRPPREFVLMDRAAVGLGSVFMHLGAEINWHRLFHDLIDDFDQHAMAARQASALSRFSIPAQDEPDAGTDPA